MQTRSDVPPDFDKLRAERNKKTEEALAEWAKDGFEPLRTLDPNRCYCDCSAHGPCEHNFTGWRDFIEDGLIAGGEAVCERCGMGAMHHSLMTCD